MYRLNNKIERDRKESVNLKIEQNSLNLTDGEKKKTGEKQRKGLQGPQKYNKHI